MAIPIECQNLFASIDMGTNSFKLLIFQFEPTTTQFTTIHKHSEPVVLGRNSSSSSTPLISQDSQFRAIEALMKFKAIIQSHNVARTRVVGTSAIREAVNGIDFINEVRKQLGFDFEVNILSGVEEARLIYFGVLQFLPVYAKKVLTLDIGGGSTEFVVGGNGEVVYADSLRLGHVTLTEKFGENDLVGLRNYVSEMVEASGLVEKVKRLGFEIVVGSSGTIRAIEKAIWCGYGCDDAGRVNKRVWGENRRRNWWFSREELSGFIERLCGVEISEREKVRRDEFFGRRSEFIVAGAVLLDELMELLGISEMQVSAYALGEGVVAEMVAEAFPGFDLNVNVRWKSVMRLAMRFNGNDRMKNGVQCSAIAKGIFEGLRKYKKVFEDHFSVDSWLNEKDLEYLEAACMLHNIGLYLGKQGYHKQSYSIVMEHSQLDGYTSEEIELIARLTRHHRKKFPKFECTFQGFSREKFGSICSILRIAFLIQKHKLLNLREIGLNDSEDGRVLVDVLGIKFMSVTNIEDPSSFHITALTRKENRSMLLDSEKSFAKDIAGKIGKEAEFFEVAFHQKLSVVVHVDCLESSTRQ